MAQDTKLTKDRSLTVAARKPPAAVSEPRPSGSGRRCLAIAILWFGIGVCASAQTRLTLQQAASRVPPDLTPAYDGKEAIVNGRVSSLPLWVSDSHYLPIQDDAAYGLLLQGSDRQFQGFEPGDLLEVQGTISKRGGIPVLLPHEIRRLSRGVPPSPKVVKPADLGSFRYLGVLVTTESTVASSGENAGGDTIVIGEKGKEVTIFLPRTRRDSGPQLTAFRTGDRIRVTGISNQYCTLPPYDRFFQILIPGPASVAMLEKAWMIRPPFLLATLMFASLLLGIWWIRERRMAALRRQMRMLNALGEEVIGATSPAEVLRRLTLTLPELSNASGIGMYILDRGTKTLETVHSASSAGEFIDLDAPEGALAAGVAACFRNRTLVAVHDTRRSPFFQREDLVVSPRSVLFVPMFAHSELLGVMELHHMDRFHYFSQSEQAAMQHLANQVATALKLQDQHSIREQFFRSEKVAASGQLISDVAGELRSPLESIAALASAVQSRQNGNANQELQTIADQARRAAEIVARLVSFAKIEQSEAEPVDVNALVSGLLKFRVPEFNAIGIELRSQLAPKRAMVMGSRGQLEQVLVNLLADAEKAAVEAREKIIAVSTSLLARRVLVEIAYPTRSSEFQRIDGMDSDHAGSGALGLGVCRGIVQSHGGEFRVVHVSSTQARFDIELPVVETRRVGVGSGVEPQVGSRQLMVLIVEPDNGVQRQLVQLLGVRGDRVVPVASAEEGADLAQRMRFDLAICAVRLPGLNWVEFFERVRHQVGSFVLVTDGFDTDLARAFQGGEGFVLSKPIDEAEVHRICRTVEERAFSAPIPGFSEPRP
jgi:signal transduction histidine kinase/ActR/RegA family two-component response regulator